MNALFDFVTHRDTCKKCCNVILSDTSTFNNTCFKGANLIKNYLHESYQNRALNKKIETVGLPNV